jgi:hypothetical protein
VEKPSTLRHSNITTLPGEDKKSANMPAEETKSLQVYLYISVFTLDKIIQSFVILSEMNIKL